VAHRWADGRWLSTGGGGYDAYRVVPRAWALTWLAGAHREAPAETPTDWRARWAAEGERYGQAPLPTAFDDAPNAGLAFDEAQQDAEAVSAATAAAVSAVVVPALIGEARRRGWWTPTDEAATRAPVAGARGTPTIVAPLRSDMLDRLVVAPRVAAPADPAAAHRLLSAALADSASVVAAISSDEIVGFAAAASGRLVGLGVAPTFRQQGLGSALLTALVEQAEGSLSAVVTLAERDPVEPLDRGLRAAIARKMLERAGFSAAPVEAAIAGLDPAALSAERR
jgi:GNAT superfamily N-acetyltransferase